MDGIASVRQDVSTIKRFRRCSEEIGRSRFPLIVLVVTDESAHDHGFIAPILLKKLRSGTSLPTLRLIEQPLFWRIPPAEGPDDLIEKEHLYVCSYS